jgi:hypothetical protein
MAVFVVLWPYLITTKLSCWQKNNFWHTIVGGGIVFVVAAFKEALWTLWLFFDDDNCPNC